MEAEEAHRRFDEDRHTHTHTHTHTHMYEDKRLASRSSHLICL
jgi:hypothetical protein